MRVCPVLFLLSITAAQCLADATHYDLLVYGTTPGGVACAVRAAREGLTVKFVSHSEHAGGMLANGLSTMDTLYSGSRSPLYDELRGRIFDYYRTTYGENSPQYLATQPDHPKTRYEASVVERIIDAMIAAEDRVSLAEGYYPVAAERGGRMLRSVTFRSMTGEATFTVAAATFADCSYEADLAAVAGVRYRVGRESREEFKEPHAGVIYMRRVPWPPEGVDAEFLAFRRGLNLFPYDEWYETIAAASTGEAHPAVQGYNMRTIVTNDPNNRVLPEKPANYDPELLRTFGHGRPEGLGLRMPNGKFGLNEPKLIGVQDAYVEGDWATRRAVIEQHKDVTIGLLYFRQNDPSIPEEIRAKWREIGLPKDEFADNGHMPYEIYARETRRIIGRAVFTEHDAQLAADLERAPVHNDSISITEWFLDSHACTPRDVEGSEPEGMVMLKNQTLPGQVSLETIIPDNTDNLLVPVCLSATHVGWGTIRLEPTWMSIAEAAAHAIVMADRDGVAPVNIDADALVRLLAEKRFLISFFNDVEGHEGADWYPAVQYLSTQGYFGTYDARPSEPLTSAVANAWFDIVGRQVRIEDVNPTGEARTVLAAVRVASEPMTAEAFARRLEQASGEAGISEMALERLGIAPSERITRGDAARLVFLVRRRHPAP